MPRLGLLQVLQKHEPDIQLNILGLRAATADDTGEETVGFGPEPRVLALYFGVGFILGPAAVVEDVLSPKVWLVQTV